MTSLGLTSEGSRPSGASRQPQPGLRGGRPQPLTQTRCAVLESLGRSRGCPSGVSRSCPASGSGGRRAGPPACRPWLRPFRTKRASPLDGQTAGRPAVAREYADGKAYARAEYPAWLSESGFSMPRSNRRGTRWQQVTYKAGVHTWQMLPFGGRRWRKRLSPTYASATCQ
jgi:hypothetical protein